MLNKRLADRELPAGNYSIADMASYPWVVPYTHQDQNLDDLRRSVGRPASYDETAFRGAAGHAGPPIAKSGRAKTWHCRRHRNATLTY